MQPPNTVDQVFDNPMIYRRHGGFRKELNVKTPFYAIEKWFDIK